VNRPHPFFVLSAIVIAGALLAGGCSAPEPDVVLTGRAVLPADTFAEGPPSGAFLAETVNDRPPPFPLQPVQGFSALLPGPERGYRALMDNGFGSVGNSGDVRLRWYDVEPDWDAGVVEVLGFTELHDPDAHYLDAPGPLTGADLDPEAFALAPNGSYWVGDEVGPFVAQFDAEGRLLGPPLEVPLPEPLRELGRGLDVLRSPDHPALAGLDDAARLAAANHPESGGFEGLAAGPAGVLLYALAERALLDDPVRTRRLLLEYDLKERAWTGRYWEYHVEDPSHSIGELTDIGGGGFLVIERDSAEGEAARFKQVFRIDLARAANGKPVRKMKVVDLLDLRDPDGLTRDAPEAFGLGPDYRFPYQKIEAVLVLSPTTLLLCNDNNYPFGDARRPGEPDDTEFIRVELPWPAAMTR
jgi:glycerophosphoryl diester phosphodiesterase